MNFDLKNLFKCFASPEENKREYYGIQTCQNIMMNCESREEDGTTSDVPPKPARRLGMRHLQTLLMFTGLGIAYTMRINLSVAIVAMVDSATANPNYPEYDWDTATQSIILSSFFWGYIVTLLPAGPISERLGAKLLLLVAMGASSMLALLTPISASWHWQAVCAIRVLQGMAQGVMTPCLHNLLASWAPIQERGRLATFAYSGAIAGIVITLPLSGLLASGSWGWPGDFYVFGLVGLVWCVTMLFLGANTPAEDRLISQEERAYIEANVGTTSTGDNKSRRTPWCEILRSPPMWAILAAHCGQYCGFWTLLIEMPTFMKTVLHFEIEANGFLSALPYLGQWICSFFFAWLSDFLNRRKFIRTVTSRRIFNTIGHWVPAAALVGLGYTNQNSTVVAVSLLVFAVTINSATYVSFTLSHIDLAPNFAGTLMGITNTAANLMSVLGPIVVGNIVTVEGSSEQWRIVFFITAGVIFFCNIIYVVFITADTQPWNERRQSTDQQRDTQL